MFMIDHGWVSLKTMRNLRKLCWRGML